MRLKDNVGIVIIMLAFICANALFISLYKDVWWDSSVYISMGKYIFSLGKSGLWEESRPLIFPFILGIGWKLGFDAIYFARIVSVIFAVLTIFMTYAIGLKLFSRKIGLLAAFFTAFSFNFLFFSSNILTEIPSTFFALLAFYFFSSDRFFLMGLFSGIAVMTRFFQVFVLFGVYLIFLVYFYKKPDFHKKLFYAALGFLLPVALYLLINHTLYSDMLLPYKTQSYLTKTTGWVMYREYWFYFSGLLKENFFLMSLLFLPFAFKRNHAFYAASLPPLIYIVIFSLVKHKEMRFMLLVLPFLCLLASYCLLEIYKKIRYKRTALALFCIMCLFWISTVFQSFSEVNYSLQADDEGFSHLQNYIKSDKGNVWITNPLYALHSDAKISGLLYSSRQMADFISKNKESADTVLFNNCDIPCPSAKIDPLCEGNVKMLQSILANFKKVYEKEKGSCRYKIYNRVTS